MWFVLPPSEVRRSHTANPPLPGLQPPSLVILLPSPPTLKQVVRRTLQRPRPQYGRLRYRCQGGSRSNVMAKLRANFAFVDTTIPRTCIRMRYASVEPGAVDCPGRNCSSHTIRPWGGDDGLDNQRLSRKIAQLRLEHETDDIWGVLVLSACSFGTSYRPLARLTVGRLSFLIIQGYIPYHQINGRLGWKNHLNGRLFTQ